MGRGCLGFGRDLGVIITTSFPELYRDNQKSLNIKFIFSKKNIIKMLFLDLDIGFHTFGAGSRAEISHRIRI